MTRGRAVFACALACGIVLRLIWPADMEWKADEQRMFTWASTIGITEPWPSIGMASGVAVPNPGLSVWLFVPLARATSAKPLSAAAILQFLNVVGLFFERGAGAYLAGLLALLCAAAMQFAFLVIRPLSSAAD